jgi:hypothetical protein
VGDLKELINIGEEAVTSSRWRIDFAVSSA